MIHSRRRPWLVAPCLALACVALAGCAAGGSGSQSGAPSGGVAVTLTAPTSGATVGVHQIQVVGTVTPSNAVVHVAGQPASVSKGMFKRVLWLRQPTTTIQITAAATGHPATTVTTTVHFSSQLAVALVAGRTASVSTTSRALASVTSPSAGHASRERVVRHRSVTAAVTTTTPASTSAPAPTTTTTTTTSSSSSPSSGSGSTKSGSGSTKSGSGSSPATPAPLTPTEIQHRYLQGCAKADGGQSAVPYCTCMYDHLLQAGALASPVTIAALERALDAFEQTQDIFALPVFLRDALSDCASDLPVPPLTITKLPPLNHGPTAPLATSAS
jgi:hypothetical protein